MIYATCWHSFAVSKSLRDKLLRLFGSHRAARCDFPHPAGKVKKYGCNLCLHALPSPLQAVKRHFGPIIDTLSPPAIINPLSARSEGPFSHAPLPPPLPPLPHLPSHTPA